MTEHKPPGGAGNAEAIVLMQGGAVTLIESFRIETPDALVRGRASELRQIIGMAWAAMVQHHIIGNVDQRRDGSLARRFQPCLHPGRAVTIFNTPDHAPEKGGASIGIVNANFGWASKASLNLRDAERF